PRVSLSLLRLCFCPPARPRDLHSSPTRRSSDLSPRRPRTAAVCAGSPWTGWTSGLAPPPSPASRPPPHPHLHSRARRSNPPPRTDRKSTRLNSSHVSISYAVFCLQKQKHLLRLL